MRSNEVVLLFVALLSVLRDNFCFYLMAQVEPVLSRDRF